MYLVSFSGQASKDKILLKAAGLEQKTKSILNILIENPFQNPPPYEKLIGNLSGFYSRRINLQHRLVYKIEEKRVMHSNAYILFYISKESPYNFDYIKMMKSLMNNIKLSDKKNKKIMIDNNFFRYEPVQVKIKTKYNIGFSYT
jgi:Txe/YoeB family toxin of toxin-antitoxin system